MFTRIKNNFKRIQGSLFEKSQLFSKPSTKSIRPHKPFYVSLTTTHNRLPFLKKTLHSLLCQTYLPEKIYVWYSREPHGLDKGLSRERVRAGLGTYFYHPRIAFEETLNIGSYRKLIPFLQRYKNVTVITADDDFLYPRHWAEKLITASLLNPGKIISHRARRIRFDGNGFKPYMGWPILDHPYEGEDVLPTGCGGILYPESEPFDRAMILDYEQALEKCGTGDDLWFRHACFLAGTRIVKIGNYPWYGFELAEAPQGLYQINKTQNDKMLKTLEPVWLSRLKKLSY